MTDNYIKILEYTTNCKKFMEEVLNLTVEPFHEEWINIFEDKRYVCLLAPRGHGKSTIVESYIIWKILIDPKIRILITTVNQNKAEEMMSFIRHHLEYNEKIIDLFGEQKSPLWSRNKLKVKNRGGGVIHKEPTLQVLGVTSSQISSHYDLIILDDVCDRKNTATAHRRRELKEWYRTEIMEMLEPNGKIFNIQTRWHSDDMHNFLSQKEDFTTIKYQAIIDHDKKEVLWPDRFSYDDLIRLRDDQIGGVAFSMQYQNEIRQTDDSPIDEEWVQDAIANWNPMNIPTDCNKYIGVDLASASEEGDFFCCVVIAKDGNGNYYVLDCVRDKVSMARQLDIIESLNIKHNPIKIGIESNATQRIITDDWKERTNLPILQLKSSWVNDKMSRVQKLAVLLETHRVSINPTLDILADEMIAFPRGMHDDTVDSLCFAIQASDDGVAKINWDDVVRMVKTKGNHPYVRKI